MWSNIKTVVEEQVSSEMYTYILLVDGQVCSWSSYLATISKQIVLNKPSNTDSSLLRTHHIGGWIVL